MKSSINFVETSSREFFPQETLKRVKEMGLVGKKSIIPKVLRVDGIDCLGIPVYFSFSKKIDSDDIDYEFTHAGKGISPEEAECSAIFEAIERYSAKMDGREIFKVGKENDINDAMSLKKFVVGDNIKQTENLVLEWTDVFEIENNHIRYVPANYVYFPYRPQSEKVKIVLPHDTNGLAAGNTITEAIIHAIYEVVEKDAFCIFWNNNDIYQNVDITEFRNKKLCDLVDKLHENRIEFVIKDMTTDIGIPAYVALLDCRSKEQPAFVYGSGAHLDPEVAILRALTEAIQLRVSQMILLRYKPELRFRKVEGLGCDSHDIIENMISSSSVGLIKPIFKDNNGKTSINRYEKYNLTTLDECLQIVVNKISCAGFEVLYKNIERENVGMPAVRVIIPGLQPSNGLPSRRSDRLREVPKYVVSNYYCNKE